MNTGVIFGQMLVLLAMMLVGYFGYRMGWLNDDFAGRLSKLVVNVFNPVLVINSVLGQSSQDGGSRVLQNVVLVFCYFVFLILIGTVVPILVHAGKYRKSLYQGMAVFANVGFMGIPVIRSVLGEEAVVYIAFYILIYNLLVYTYGVFLAGRSAGEYAAGRRAGADRSAGAGGKAGAVPWDTAEEQQRLKKGSWKRILNPGVVASLIAVVLFLTGISVPEPVYTFCDYMGNTTIPLSMILIGVSMAQTNLKEVFGEWRIYWFILLRMVLFPIAMNWLLQSFLLPHIQVDPIVYGVFILEFGMPVGSIIALVVKEQGAEGDYCMKGVVLSTIASIVTIPIVCAFL